MTFLTIATLEEWIDQFRALGYAVPDDVRVVPQDGGEGADTGLVVATLDSVPTKLYIQPVEVGSLDWCVTFEPRAEASATNAATVMGIATELMVISALCAFLEARARAHATPDAI
ncbi:hypothetical protein [Microbacterium sp. 10M-3C3]|jgi:hypothetical protein|uniref:hypothetical protein n=1 Tax=Microbacterium sp. 10M-3C3 TaxID=2483401 RepID=UPI000F63D39D|nr:hypothetical protein [Microbacterium sp. 10M-3C3]